MEKIIGNFQQYKIEIIWDELSLFENDEKFFSLKNKMVVDNILKENLIQLIKLWEKNENLNFYLSSFFIRLLKLQNWEHYSIKENISNEKIEKFLLEKYWKWNFEIKYNIKIDKEFGFIEVEILLLWNELFEILKRETICLFCSNHWDFEPFLDFFFSWDFDKEFKNLKIFLNEKMPKTFWPLFYDGNKRIVILTWFVDFLNEKYEDFNSSNNEVFFEDKETKEAFYSNKTNFELQEMFKSSYLTKEELEKCRKLVENKIGKLYVEEFIPSIKDNKEFFVKLSNGKEIFYTLVNCFSIEYFNIEENIVTISKNQKYDWSVFSKIANKKININFETLFNHFIKDRRNIVVNKWFFNIFSNQQKIAIDLNKYRAKSFNKVFYIENFEKIKNNIIEEFQNWVASSCVVNKNRNNSFFSSKTTFLIPSFFLEPLEKSNWSEIFDNNNKIVLFHKQSEGNSENLSITLNNVSKEFVIDLNNTIQEYFVKVFSFNKTMKLLEEEEGKIRNSDLLHKLQWTNYVVEEFNNVFEKMKILELKTKQVEILLKEIKILNEEIKKSQV